MSFSTLHSELEMLKESGLYRFLRRVDSDQDAVLTLGEKQYINFSSNNYLGLANDARLKAAAIEAIEEFGTSAGASRLITGSMKLHQDLEGKIAQFKNTQAALLFNSGYHANLGVLTALLREGDIVFSDALNHASLIDGCRLSRAKIEVYRHCDPQHLEDLVKKNLSRRTARRLIVTDSIFSMDGDAAPLRDLAELAEKYDCFLMVDEAHATGVYGPTGKGLVEEFWPRKRPLFLQERLIQMGTFGKALGSFGAYVAGSKVFIEYLINKARPLIYTTALPPAVAAAALAALEIVEKEPGLRRKLWENISYFLSRFEQRQVPNPLSLQKGPILPLLIGSSEKALQISQQLFEKGFLISPIRYPTVPQGTERIRMTLMARHTFLQIDQLLTELEEMSFSDFNKKEL